jgi:hypothetical protein
VNVVLKTLLIGIMVLVPFAVVGILIGAVVGSFRDAIRPYSAAQNLLLVASFAYVIAFFVVLNRVLVHRVEAIARWRPLARWPMVAFIGCASAAITFAVVWTIAFVVYLIAIRGQRMS